MDRETHWGGTEKKTWVDKETDTGNTYNFDALTHTKMSMHELVKVM